MILDGKALSIKLKKNLKEEVVALSNIYNKKPSVAIILVGENQASQIYVRNKIKAAEYIGITPRLITRDANISMKELLDIIEELNKDEEVNGIIVQLPLPKHLNEQEVINKINDTKDVDGFGLLNKGKLFSGLPCIPSATPAGIMKLLDEYNIELKGKRAVVVGRSNIVGKPMAIMLMDRHATITIAHSRTADLASVTKEADVLVVAIGKARFITADMVKKGAVVVDVGMNREDGALCGDVDFENVEKVASYITPVPGGVGPLTIASLLENTIEAFKNQQK